MANPRACGRSAGVPDLYHLEAGHYRTLPSVPAQVWRWRTVSRGGTPEAQGQGRQVGWLGTSLTTGAWVLGILHQWNAKGEEDF